MPPRDKRRVFVNCRASAYNRSRAIKIVKIRRMTGRQLYNYLLTSAYDNYEMYVVGFRDESLVVDAIDFSNGHTTDLICSKVETGPQHIHPVRAEYVFRHLHDMLDKGLIDNEVRVTKRNSGWRGEKRELVSATEVPCYKGRALCLNTRSLR